jgi:hypothetical protein
MTFDSPIVSNLALIIGHHMIERVTLCLPLFVYVPAFSDTIGRRKAALLIAVCPAMLFVWVVNSPIFIEVLFIGSLLDIFDPRPSIQGSEQT